MTELKKPWYYLEGEDKKVVKAVTWRAMRVNTSFQFEKMQAIPFLHAMVPVIETYYKDAPLEKKIEAYKREWELFNITPQLAPFLGGITAAMEKEASRNPDYDAASINAVKASLMGPLSGIGDSLFWGSLKVIATGIAVPFAQLGSLLGPVLYFLIYNIPSSLIRHILPIIGFKQGSSFLANASKSGTIAKITKYANIIGLMTLGAMVTTTVNVKFALTFTAANNVSFALQDVIDSIAPAILPMALTLYCMNIMKKKNVQPFTIILFMIVIAILGSLVGIL